MADTHETATKMVLDLLKDPSINKIRFKNVNHRSIKPSMFQKVAAAIEAKQIMVRVYPGNLPSGLAGLYFPELKIDDDNIFYDIIVLRADNLGTTLNDQFHMATLIVHECAHAGFDLLKLEKMSHLEHETSAYIAGAIFAVEKMIALGGDPEKVKPTAPIEKAAWDIGKLEAKDQKVSKEIYNALDVAVTEDPHYKDNIKRMVKNNGVGRNRKVNGKDV